MAIPQWAIEEQEGNFVVNSTMYARLNVWSLAWVFQGLVNSKAVHLDLIRPKTVYKLLLILINAKRTISFAIPQIRATMVYFQVSSAGSLYKF